MHILILDDSVSDRLLVERQLRQAFADLKVTSIGEEARFAQVLEAGEFDFVITDYHLQWSNGLEVLQQVKRRYPDCPVVMFTNTGTQEIAVEGMKQGLDDYLIKSPKHFIRLVPTVQLVLQRIEDRKQRALAELRLQSLLNQLEIGVFRIRSGGEVIEANLALLQLLGVGSLAEVDMRLGTLLFSNGQELQLHQRVDRQTQIRNALGEDLWLRVSETLNSVNGQLVIDGVVEDITRLKQAEAGLRRYTRRLEILQELNKSILQSEPTPQIAQTALDAELELLPVQLLDISLIDLERNQTVVLAIQSSKENIRYGLECGEIISAADWGEIEKLKQNQEIVISDLASVLRTPVLQRLFEQGIRTWVSVPIYTEERLIGAFSAGSTEPNALTLEEIAILKELATQLTISVDQSRLREELRRYAEELEKLVRDRTQQLEEANQDLDTYAHSISQNFQARLRGVRAYAEALQQDHGEALDATPRQWLRYILQETKQIEAIVQGLLVYNRLNRSRLTLHPLNLNSVVSDTLDQVEWEVQQTEAKVMVNSPLLPVIGHYSTLIQVMASLLTNAMRFVAPDARPTVRVWAEQRKQYVRLWVEDQGIGIAPENQDRIFEIFERLHAEETYPGTGIGLAVVRRAVQCMGGQVGVESRLGHGSQFWIELPAANNLS
ncbi:ATP-binding protein [Leptolyngbya sp. FACHB-17]|uniref:ATP-binding protein n=1 Tax=Leptolyngbyales TaxID=3079749 RepID=UPI001681389E|nr:ATP-binding protein [Leptolyngbya sp. FACHB-17]MBD2082881.1 response regulator [Leptolyngbya sp. FACHB-17]